MADDQLDILEKKILLLENIVFGTSDKDALYPKGVKEREECIDSLHNVMTKTTSSVKGKRRINSAFDKVPEIQKYMDPSYTDEMVLSDSAKADLILAEEDFIKKQANRLETMQELEQGMDTQHMRALPTLSTKLKELSQIQLTQQDKTSNFTEDVDALLSSYNNIISLISKQFVQWDEVITSLEIAQQPKKSH